MIEKDTPEFDDKFYGRRSGRPIKPSQRKLLDELLPQLQITNEQIASLSSNMDFPSLLQHFNFLGSPNELWLEIGFGGGEHLAAQAEQNPNVAFIGCEPFINGISSLLKHIKHKNLQNIRILPDDCRPFLKALPKEIFSKIFLLFSDPWPKRRHHDRRVINPDNLDLFSSLMKKNAELRVATDDPSLIKWSFEHLQAHPDFTWANPDPTDHQKRPMDWPPTRYEEKALCQGRKPFYFSYLKKTS